MKTRFDEMPVLVEPVMGVSIRGAAEGGMVVTRMHFPAGVDLSEVLPGRFCPVPHWGLVLEGRVVIRYDDGTDDVAEAGDAYYMRPGHAPSFDADTTMIEVSPEAEMLDILHRVMGAVDQRTATGAES